MNGWRLAGLDHDDLRDIIIRRCDELDAKHVGQNYMTPHGYVDLLLYRESEAALLIVEIKTGKAGPAALSQLLSYVWGMSRAADFRCEHSPEIIVPTTVRGVLVTTTKQDDRVLAACAGADVEVWLYAEPSKDRFVLQTPQPITTRNIDSYRNGYTMNAGQRPLRDLERLLARDMT